MSEAKIKQCEIAHGLNNMSDQVVCLNLPVLPEGWDLIRMDKSDSIMVYQLPVALNKCKGDQGKRGQTQISQSVLPVNKKYKALREPQC